MVAMEFCLQHVKCEMFISVLHLVEMLSRQVDIHTHMSLSRNRAWPKTFESRQLTFDI